MLGYGTTSSNQIPIDSDNIQFLNNSGIIIANAILDFPNTAAQTSSDLTITVKGALLNDVVMLGVPNGSVLSNSCFTAWVSATDVVTVRFNNYSSGALDVASGCFKIKVWR